MNILVDRWMFLPPTALRNAEQFLIKHPVFKFQLSNELENEKTKSFSLEFLAFTAHWKVFLTNTDTLTWEKKQQGAFFSSSEGPPGHVTKALAFKWILQVTYSAQKVEWQRNPVLEHRRQTGQVFSQTVPTVFEYFHTSLPLFSADVNHLNLTARNSLFWLASLKVLHTGYLNSY